MFTSEGAEGQIDDEGEKDGDDVDRNGGESLKGKKVPSSQ